MSAIQGEERAQRRSVETLEQLERDMQRMREEEFAFGVRIVIDWSQPLSRLRPKYRRAARLLAEPYTHWLPPRGKSTPLRNPLEDV